jgi:lipopolysaccharide/colanic/teichoic acid biosynthesis glycosyltransferase
VTDNPLEDGTVPTVRRPVRAAHRALDLVVTTVLLVLLAVPMLVIAAAVRIGSPGPALFCQPRVGRFGEPFVMYKFRSMRVGAGEQGEREQIAGELSGERLPERGSFKPDRDVRVTRLGAVLRRTSLDELPQLLNVLRGDMALVGPRPCLPWEAEMFPPEFRPRFSVPPGITGLWQVSGRSRLSTLDMLRLDVAYVRSRSLGTDLRILLRTGPALLRGDGAR